MSSLGYQAVYRQINNLPGLAAERAFLPDHPNDRKRGAEPLQTYETRRLVSDFPVIAFSLAYELELEGLVQCLELSGLPPLAEDRLKATAAGGNRGPSTPGGGWWSPYLFQPSSRRPLFGRDPHGRSGGFAAPLYDAIAGTSNREALLEKLSKWTGMYVPSIHGETPPPVAAADNSHLPAHSQIITPNTELSDMFLIEAERGCHRACTYCVMRRSTNGGMRTVPFEKVMVSIPDNAHKVGLVGAAVTDHPDLPKILRALVDSDRKIGISSLRADRLTHETVSLLKKGGYHSLTTALDGSSERLRSEIKRGTCGHHVERVARLCADVGFPQLKIYLMVGLPDETEADIEELADYCQELSRIGPKIALGIAPFVAKRNTPLDRTAFAGIAKVESQLRYLRKLTRGRVDLRPTPAKWAWVEYRLAQGGFAAGRAALNAARAGGKFAD